MSEDGQYKRHPKSQFEAKYPHNKVMVTESGHEIHYDDTPSKERIRIAHKQGSYTEYGHDGRVVHLTTGHQINYAKGGITITTDKNYDTKVGGSSRVNISGHSHTEVNGTMSQAVEGDVRSAVGGDSVSVVKGDMMMGASGKMTVKIGKGMEFKGDGNMEMNVNGKSRLETTDMQIVAKDKITFKVGGSEIVMTDGQIIVKSGSIKFQRA